MARRPKIKINSELLDTKIRAIDKASFNQTKISKFIIGKGSTYYCEMMKSGYISEESLERLCEYYNLDKEEFLITEEVEKKQIQQQADTQNYENLILLLTGMSKTMTELLAQYKATNYMLGEIRTSLLNEHKTAKEILEKLEQMEKKQSKYNKY